MHTDCVALIDAIIELRKKQGVSQLQLAEMTGLAQPAIARLEQKRITPTIETVCRILKALDAALIIKENIVTQHNDPCD